jgi:flagellar protein FliO/FliZ
LRFSEQTRMWKLSRTAQFCSALLAIALFFPQQPLFADEAATQSAGSFAAPAAFQSPISDAQSSTNTAAAIDNRAAAANLLAQNTTVTNEPAVSANTKSLAPIVRSDRSPPRLSPAAGKETSRSTTSGTQSLVTVLGSLGIVLGLFLVTMWLFRGSVPNSAQTLPLEVVEPLGRSPVAKGQQLQLFRFGGKLVLVSVSPTGVDTISEIVDPVEVDRLAGLCLRNGPLSSTQAFRTVLDSFAGRGASARSDSVDLRREGQTRAWARARGRSREDDDV